MVKKQLIMEKALELFAKQGIEATPVQQITDYCGISKGAFYLSFKSKDELIIALIDDFMMQIIAEIDYKVININDDELLYEFYYTTFSSFHKHSDFANIFIKEETHSFNEKFFEKIHYYNKVMEKIISSMIDRLYGDTVRDTKFDLIYCIKGFMKTYSELFLFYSGQIDLHLLSQSLVEKTNLLAKHMTLPFISQDFIQTFKFRRSMNERATKEDIIEMLQQRIDDVEEPIIKESLILLEQQVNNPTLSPAIVKGLLENIRKHPHCKWISYLLHHYFEGESND